jgi:hypothetical protein
MIVRFHRSDPGSAIQCEIRREDESSAAVPSVGEAALGKIFEVRLNLRAVGLHADHPFDFQVTLWENNLPVETLPLEGCLSVPAQA